MSSYRPSVGEWRSPTQHDVHVVRSVTTVIPAGSSKTRCILNVDTIAPFRDTSLIGAEVAEDLNMLVLSFGDNAGLPPQHQATVRLDLPLAIQLLHATTNDDCLCLSDEEVTDTDSPAVLMFPLHAASRFTVGALLSRRLQRYIARRP
jgi:hypothetical protein